MASGMNWAKARKPRADETTSQMRRLERQADTFLALHPGKKKKAKAPKRRDNRGWLADLMKPRITGADNVIPPHPDGVLPWE